MADAPMKPDPSWYYNPESWWVKLFRFLHLLEDELVQISHTGFTMWATTLNNLHGLIFTHDVATIGGGIVANIAGLWAHTAKRGQKIKEKEGDQ
jgi:hypothetical protein